MSAQLQYQNGDLQAAAIASAEELRNSPTDLGKRAFFAELLCLQSEFERADRQLETLLSLDPRSVVTVGTWRQLLRAATARQDVFRRGALPEVVDSMSPRIKTLLEILVAVREERFSEAAAKAEELESARAPLPCRVNGEPVEDLRDADDLSAGVLEVLATNGKYFWIDMEKIVSLQFQAPERPLDLLWRRAEIVLVSGTEGQVLVPAVYATATEDPAALLGRKTDWLDNDGLVRGVGQRLWLIGDEACPLTELETVDFERA